MALQVLLRMYKKEFFYTEENKTNKQKCLFAVLQCSSKLRWMTDGCHGSAISHGIQGHGWVWGWSGMYKVEGCNLGRTGLPYPLFWQTCRKLVMWCRHQHASLLASNFSEIDRQFFCLGRKQFLVGKKPSLDLFLSLFLKYCWKHYISAALH